MVSIGKERKIWHEDDHFWETLYPILFNQRRWDVASYVVEKLIDLLDIHPGAKVLDLCCGPGRHSLELARRGFCVSGVDRTSAYLKIAREKAESEDLKIDLVQEDMRHFCRPGTYDGVISLFTSFGYFEDPKDDQQVLFNVYRSLKDGGKLVMHLMGKEVLARIFQERDWREENGIIIMEERKVEKDWSWVHSRWILLKGGIREEFRVSHRIYSASELAALLKECGFRSISAYGDFEYAPYDHKATRLVMVAQK